MTTRTRLMALLAVLACVLGLAFPGLSSATFTSSSRSTATITAASDWTPPTVAVVSPGTAVKDVATITVAASDAESGLASVTLEQQAPNAGTWVTVCTDTTAPYSCAWDTRSLADGLHSLRARALDRAGYETTSEVVRTTVANKLLITLADPGDAVRGTVTLQAAVHNVGSLSHTVRIEYRETDASSWSTLCTGLRAPYTCAWNTTASSFNHKELDLRAVLVTGTATTVSEVVEAVQVDNTAPTVTLADPGSPLSGTRTFTATAADAHTDVDRVVLQYAATGTSTWSVLCTATTSPWSCRAATTTLPDGSYSFRAVAHDLAGNSTTSAVVADRIVNNTVASISVDAAAQLRGRVTVRADATSTAGITSVRLETAPAGTTAWTVLCTDTTAPYSCAWDTTTVTDGRYDLRAVMIDTLGRSTTSPTSTGHIVDNAVLRGVDVQTTNGSLIAGLAEGGDTITYTFSEQIQPHSVLAGWNGTARDVTLRMRDGSLLGSGSRDDTVDVLAGSTAVNLGTVNLKQDYVKPNRTLTYNATMTLGTTTNPQGVVGSTVTLRLDSLPFLQWSHRRTVRTGSTMVWTPSAAVLGLNGRTASAAPVNETGALDREF